MDSPSKLRVPMNDGVFVDSGLFGVALRSGFPGIQLGPGAYVRAGWEAWVRFCQHSSPGERRVARAALEERAMPDPGREGASLALQRAH